MNIHRLFDEKSDIYAKSRPHYPKELFQFLHSLCSEHNAVWDAACGNGQASVDLADFFKEVYATDVSEQQIKHAQPKSNIHYSVQQSEKTNFPDQFFDMVCVAEALHWFDHDQFWREVKRVLKPHGVIAVWGYSWFNIEPEIDSVIKTDFLDIIAPYWPKQAQLLWNHYQDIPMPFSPINAPELVMEMEWTLDQVFMFLHSWSATRRCMDDIGDAFFHQAYDKVKALWGAFL